MKITGCRVNAIGSIGVALWGLLARAAIASDYPTTVLSFNPVGYWRFLESVPSPPLNVITNATALGSVANGYCVADATKGQPGIVGNSVRFNNSGNNVSNVGSKIDVPWSAALNPGPPLSIEFWAKPNSLGTDSTGFCPLANQDPNFALGSRVGWIFYLNNAGRWQFRLGNRNFYAGTISATNGFALPSQWQHVVATWDGRTANLYVNGMQVGSGAVSVTNWVNNRQSFLRFGGTPQSGQNAISPFYSTTSNNGDRGFDGWLDEVAIYSNVLSAPVINSHYAAALTNNAGYDAQILAANPIAYWPLDDAAVAAPTNFPVAVNSGSLGSAANGTNYWGALAAQSGPGHAGFGVGAQAIFFDGDNGYCQISDAPGLHFSNTVTLAAWIKPMEKDYFRDIFDHGAFDPATTFAAETFLRISRGPGADGTGDGNYYEMGGSDGVTYSDSVLFPIPPSDIGNWVFLAGTFDGTNWNLYRNGVPAGSVAASAGDHGVVDVTNRWTIGSRSADAWFVGQGEFFGGTIAEPAIFTNALSATEISNLYNAARVPPVMTRAPTNPGIVSAGATVTFSVWAEGSPTLGYLWTSNAIPTGLTTTNYAISNISAGSYTIAVIVTNAYGTNTASVTFQVVNQPPFITTQPGSTMRFAGFPFTLSVAAGGSPPLDYSWMVNNAAVQTGASPSYTAVASLTNAGAYTVVISNVTGLNATSAPAVLTVNPIPIGYTSNVLASGPIAYYRLDELSGSVCHDGISGIDGVYHNTTLGVPGYSVDDPDTASSFSGVNSYAGFNLGALKFTGHTNFTLEAWVKAPAGQINDSAIIASGTGADGIHFEQYCLDVDAGVFRFLTAGPLPTTSACLANIGPDGLWHHIVAVYDDLNALGGGQLMYLYVDGGQQSTHSTLAAGLNGSIGPVSIGSKRTGSDPNYNGTLNGTLDEVAVYNKALDAATIYNHYASAYGPITLTFQRVAGTNLRLTWPAGALQSATNVAGPYITITNAVSPYTTGTTGLRQFYRVKL